MLDRIFAAALFLAVTATLSAQSNVSFELSSDAYAAGGALATGDFNNNGVPDLVECCAGPSHDLQFRAGNGDGTFRSPVDAGGTSQTGAGSLIAADFNGDGKLDLAGVGPSELYIWYGNGNGTFQSPQVYATDMSPWSIAVGNFFGDGHPDIVLGESTGEVVLFRNEGSSFVYDESINLNGSGQPGTIMVDAGDLNGNGISDIAASISYATSPSATYVLWNDGKGNLTQQELGIYNKPFVRMSRLNGDGMMDIIVGYTCSGSTTPNGSCAGFDVYYGQGNNKLVKRTVISDPGVTGPGTYEDLDVRGADVDGDGYGDLVESTGSDCWCSFGLFVWKGNADGSFQQTPEEFIASTNSAGPMVMGDFNRDGMMDFAVGENSNGNPQIYINATNREACGRYTISPSVTACQPVDNTYSPSPVRVEANSYDTTTVTAMQEYVDYKLTYSQPVTSFDTTFAEGLGSHLFVTKGWDASGRSFVADRTVTVYNGTPGPVCPAAPGAASICVPSGTSSSSPVLIVANGDTGTAVPTAAQLYIDGTLVANNQGYCYQQGNCAGGTSYVATTQNLSAGSHELVFKLWDASGNVHQAEKTITVD